MPFIFKPTANGRQLLNGERGNVSAVPAFVAKQAKLPVLTDAELESITDYEPPTPPVPVPQKLTQSQVYLAFLAKGISRAELDAMIEAAIVGGIPEKAQNAHGVLLREEARTRWDAGADVHRSNPLLAAVAGHFGYDTPEKLDAFFIATAQL